MSAKTIHCLVYRYKRIKERLYAVKYDETQYIPFDEISYKTDSEFFLNSDFSKFLGSTSNFYDLCIINENDNQGEEFVRLFQMYYKCSDEMSTIWTENRIKDALSCLNLRKSLRIFNSTIDGKDNQSLDVASVYNRVNLDEDIDDSYRSNPEVPEIISEEISIQFNVPEILPPKEAPSQSEGSKEKSDLSLAMDEIISETYKS